MLLECKCRISKFNILGKYEVEGSDVVEVEVKTVELDEKGIIMGFSGVSGENVEKLVGL